MIVSVKQRMVTIKSARREPILTVSIIGTIYRTETETAGGRTRSSMKMAIIIGAIIASVFARADFITINPLQTYNKRMVKIRLFLR